MCKRKRTLCHTGPVQGQNTDDAKWYTCKVFLIWGKLSWRVFFCTINFVTCVKILTCIPSRAWVQKGPYLSFKVYLVILCTRLKNFYQFLFIFIWLSQLNIDVAFRLEFSWYSTVWLSINRNGTFTFSSHKNVYIN